MVRQAALIATWSGTLRHPSGIAKLPKGTAKERLQKNEHAKASIRAKVEHPFRVIKRQFDLAKVRFRGCRKHGPSADAVRAFDSVDGAQTANDIDGSSPPENGVRAQKSAKTRRARR